MRVRANYVRMHKRRPMTLAAILRRSLKGAVAGHRIGAIYFFEMKVRKARNQARDASAGSLHLHRHRDGVAVILHRENYRQPAQGRGIHRLPELTLAGSAIAQRDIGHFVIVEGHVFELAIVERGSCGGWPLARILRERWN